MHLAAFSLFALSIHTAAYLHDCRITFLFLVLCSASHYLLLAWVRLSVPVKVVLDFRPWSCFSLFGVIWCGCTIWFWFNPHVRETFYKRILIDIVHKLYSVKSAVKLKAYQFQGFFLLESSSNILECNSTQLSNVTVWHIKTLIYPSLRFQVSRPDAHATSLSPPFIPVLLPLPSRRSHRRIRSIVVLPPLVPIFEYHLTSLHSHSALPDPPSC